MTDQEGHSVDFGNVNGRTAGRDDSAEFDGYIVLHFML